MVFVLFLEDVQNIWEGLLWGDTVLQLESKWP